MIYIYIIWIFGNPDARCKWYIYISFFADLRKPIAGLRSPCKYIFWNRLFSAIIFYHGFLKLPIRSELLARPLKRLPKRHSGPPANDIYIYHFPQMIYIYIIYILRQDFFEVDFGTFTLQKLPLRQVMSLKSMVHVRLYSRNNPWNFETILRGVQKSTFCDAIHRIWLKLRDDSVNNPNDIYIYISHMKIQNYKSAKCATRSFQKLKTLWRLFGYI